MRFFTKYFISWFIVAVAHMFCILKCFLALIISFRMHVHTHAYNTQSFKQTWLEFTQLRHWESVQPMSMMRRLDVQECQVITFHRLQDQYHTWPVCQPYIDTWQEGSGWHKRVDKDPWRRRRRDGEGGNGEKNEMMATGAKEEPGQAARPWTTVIDLLLALHLLPRQLVSSIFLLCCYI